MRAGDPLRMRAGAIELAGPVVLGALIDPRGDALPSFARFGVGMIEVGPVAEQGSGAVSQWHVDLESRTISGGEDVTVSVDDVARSLERADPRVPVCVRIARQDGAAVKRIVERLRERAATFIVDPSNVDDAQGSRPVLALDMPHEHAAGVWLRPGAGRDRIESLAARVRELRKTLPTEAVIAAGGVAEPRDVRELLDAGANLAVVDAGLVCSGPGLIKRCNEALLSSIKAEPPEPLTLDAARRSWFWALMLGAAMFFGGLLAVAIASTRVVLPYDESLSGLTRAQMLQLNPHLLAFMAHDRISLAGAMLSLGILYSALGWSGIRRGAHWAWVTTVVSAATGFVSFFSFLGFGYFDPFHAFVTAILTQFLLLCLVLPLSPLQPPVAEWRETAAWRRGQWGQLLFITLGVGLTGAGIVITAVQFRPASDHLLPLVAHDRATLGGMLISNGLAVWLAAQWGFRAGARWLWIALAWSGNLAFACALGVHLVVGYHEALHLAPAILGWVLWNVALGLTRGWMTTP